MRQNAALIFAKYPTASTVKTRMTPPLPGEEAAELHEACLRMVCENVASVGTLEMKLIVTPDDRTTQLARRVGLHEGDAWPQGDGDLGDRLNRAVVRAFDSDVRSVLLLGADSPTLSAEKIHEAIDALEEHQAVLGPCEDGGYYLLGLSAPTPALLTRIDWGSDSVTDQTRQRADEAGIDLHQLSTWYDLDRFEDIARARRDLSNMDLLDRPLAQALLERVTGLVNKYSER
jgi:rSAM/selenodomain-associated transferase 1